MAASASASASVSVSDCNVWGCGLDMDKAMDGILLLKCTLCFVRSCDLLREHELHSRNGENEPSWFDTSVERGFGCGCGMGR